MIIIIIYEYVWLNMHDKNLLRVYMNKLFQAQIEKHNLTNVSRTFWHFYLDK